MPDQDHLHMGVALTEAKQALAQGVFPVGAALFKGDDLIAAQRKDSDSRYFGHAETNLLRSVFTNSSTWMWEDGLTIYATLEPCIMCFGAILSVPINRLVFGMPDPWAGCTHIQTAGMPHRHMGREVRVEGGVRAKEAAALFARHLANDANPRWVTGPERKFAEAVAQFSSAQSR